MMDDVNLKHYMCFNNISIYASVKYNIGSDIYASINYNTGSEIRVWYEIKNAQWFCSTLKLTEKNNIIIYNLIKNKRPKNEFCVNCSNYNITTLLLLKEIVNKHLIIDLFPLLFNLTD